MLSFARVFSIDVIPPIPDMLTVLCDVEIFWLIRLTDLLTCTTVGSRNKLTISLNWRSNLTAHLPNGIIVHFIHLRPGVNALLFVLYS